MTENSEDSNKCPSRFSLFPVVDRWTWINKETCRQRKLSEKKKNDNDSSCDKKPTGTFKQTPAADPR